MSKNTRSYFFNINVTLKLQYKAHRVVFSLYLHFNYIKSVTKAYKDFTIIEIVGLYLNNHFNFFSI